MSEETYTRSIPGLNAIDRMTFTLSNTESTTDEDDGGSQTMASADRTETESGGGPGESGGDRDTDTLADESIPKDVAFDILKNKRRRMVLRYLFDHENPVQIGTLAEHVASIENDKPVGQLNSRERKRAYVGLYQAHLPRMHDAGVIEFNQDRGLVSLGRHSDAMVPYLDDDDEESASTPWLYIALSTIGAGAYLISHSGALGASAIGNAFLGLVLIAMLAIAGREIYQRHSDE